MSSASSLTTEKLVWAMNQWLTCPTLDPMERQLVEHMAAAAPHGPDAWKAIRDQLAMSFWPTILSAITKAREAGILREWPETVS